MALLKPKKTGKRRIRTHGVILCPLNGFQPAACLRLCTPIGDKGLCGRLAPHTLVGRTQAAIAAYKARNQSDS